ncbi:MAG: hypothetical protein KAR38_05030, partial [Calditrichia bacterium]|nr:hypothetical protein [Calditrichia bacterium]
MKRKFFPLSLALILTGIVMGLVISGAFDITTKSTAEALPETTINSDSPQTQPSDYPVLDQLSNAFIEVAAKVTPSVVTVYTEQKVKINRHPFFDFPLEDFFGRPSPDRKKEREYTQKGLGSGIIVSKDGYILTNN